MTRQVRVIRRIGDNLLVTFDDGFMSICPQVQSDYWIGRSITDGTNPSVTPNPNPGSGGGSIGTGSVTAEMVEAAVNSAGGSLSAMKASSSDIATAFNEAINLLEPGQFGTKARLACMVGECAQETDWYKTFEEYAKNGSYAPYWGRGFIQLTWQGNYQGFTDYLNSKGQNVNFVANYDMVKELPYAAYAAVYYFSQTYRENKSLLQWCDDIDDGSGDWSEVSGIINAGNPYYVGPSWGLRNAAINAAYAVAPNPTTASGNAGELAKQFALNTLGRFMYSQSTLRNDMMNTNAGDCSSFTILCYTQTSDLTNEDFGGSGTYPGYTGTLGKTGTWVNNTGDASNMQIGDVVLLGSGWPWTSAALYIGDGQIAHHGGPDNGPKIESLANNISWFGNVEVRRYV